jgi:hypothetical protein
MGTLFPREGATQTVLVFIIFAGELTEKAAGSRPLVVRFVEADLAASGQRHTGEAAPARGSRLVAIDPFVA